MAIFNAPRITTAQRNSLTLSASEVVFDTDEKIFYGGDGSTVGGFPIGSGSSTSQAVVCRNSTGSTIPQFMVVYINGALGNEPTIQLALANTDPTSSKTFGVTKLPIANNTSGVIIHSGEIDDLNTSAFAAGDFLWLSPTTAGLLTSTRPTPPNHAVFVGYVIRSHPTLGKIIVTIQNGFEIQELHNVLINGVSNGDVIHYESATSLWKNHTLTKSDVGLSNVDNTSDINKQISTATQTALNTKVDKIVGKGLSTEDYTTVEKSKLAGIATGATANQTDAYLLNRTNHTGTQAPSTIVQNISNRFVTDAEKATWNGKENAITAGTTSQYFRGDKTFQPLNAENIPMVSEAISVEDKLISLQDEISGEIANRIFADEELQSAIDGEIANRIFADEELQSAIDSIPAIYDTIDSVNDKISSANAYTDEVATLTLLAANIYSDDASAGAVGSANAYTDSQIAAVPYANNTLSNLGSTAVNNSINPDSNVTHTLGASGLNWLSVATQSVLFDDSINIDVQNRKLIDSATKTALDYESRHLLDTDYQQVLDWGNCTIDKNRFGLIGDSFETVSKNLKQYNYVLNYSSGVLTDIVYDIPDVGAITKTLNYTSGVLTSVVLSGSTPLSIQLTKTLTYTSGALTSIEYT